MSLQISSISHHTWICFSIFMLKSVPPASVSTTVEDSTVTHYSLLMSPLASRHQVVGHQWPPVSPASLLTKDGWRIRPLASPALYVSSRVMPPCRRASMAACLTSSTVPPASISTRDGWRIRLYASHNLQNNYNVGMMKLSEK